MSHFTRIRDWHSARGLPCGTALFQDPDFRKRRARLVAEECYEMLTALGFDCQINVGDSYNIFFERDSNVEYPHDLPQPDAENFLKECCDLDFVTDGCIAELGWDMDEARRRVQASNDTKGTERDENGKLRKGPDYRPPDLSDLIGGA